MPFVKWFKKVEKKISPVTEWTLFRRVAVFSFAVFLIAYYYVSKVTPHSTLNKAVADTAAILVGLSMVLSSICYFWDFADTKIIYRKHLGVVGFAYAVAHLLLSQPAFLALFTTSWLSPRLWPAIAGLVATLIFALMTIISNQYSAHKLGGITWRRILRTGYIAILFVWLHVVLLKWQRWQTWWQEGPDSLPSLSLLVSMFLVGVVMMRVLLWWSLLRKAKQLRAK